MSLRKAIGWAVCIAVIAALYVFKRESFWGIVAVLSCPAIIAAMIVGALKKASGPATHNKRNKNWHPSGQTDKEWAEENDRRQLGEDY